MPIILSTPTSAKTRNLSGNSTLSDRSSLRELGLNSDLFAVVDTPAHIIRPLLHAARDFSDISRNVRNRWLAPAEAVIEIKTDQRKVLWHSNPLTRDKLQDRNQLMGFVNNQSTRRTHLKERDQ